jgi:hypothetical protein
MRRGNKTFRWFAVALVASWVGWVSTTGSARADSASIQQLAAADATIENPSSPPCKSSLTPDDAKFLDELERRGVQFFVDSADPVTGLMPDRAKADGSAPGDIASIASVGFGLSCLCVGEEHGWVSHDKAYDLSLRVIGFLRNKAPQEHGYFYHWLKMKTGERAWDSELSSIDTALLMAGVLTVRQHFAGTELAKAADDLYGRVEWPWMLSPNGTLWMGWRQPKGFYSQWGDFNEGPLLYLLALGSQTHPLPASAWHAWKRTPVVTYAGLTFMQCPPLFTHQYPQCWFDLRGLRDDEADFFRNSQLATIAQRQWTLDVLKPLFSTYGPNFWGLTASDAEGGYVAWGGPPRGENEDNSKIDGSVTPHAPAGSLAFEPRLCLDDLENMRSMYGQKAFLKYGFVDAFNPASGWYDKDVLGIDIGPSVLMAENCRTGFVWKTFMSCPEAKAAMKAAGFRALSPSDDRPTTSLFTESQTAGTGG